MLLRLGRAAIRPRPSGRLRVEEPVLPVTAVGHAGHQAGDGPLGQGDHHQAGCRAHGCYQGGVDGGRDLGQGARGGPGQRIAGPEDAQAELVERETAADVDVEGQRDRELARRRAGTGADVDQRLGVRHHRVVGLAERVALGAGRLTRAVAEGACRHGDADRADLVHIRLNHGGEFVGAHLRETAGDLPGARHREGQRSARESRHVGAELEAQGHRSAGRARHVAADGELGRHGHWRLKA